MSWVTPDGTEVPTGEEFAVAWRPVIHLLEKRYGFFVSEIHGEVGEKCGLTVTREGNPLSEGFLPRWLILALLKGDEGDEGTGCCPSERGCYGD